MPKKKTALTIEERLQQALVPAEEQPYEVPENWVWVRLGSLADVKGGKRLPKGTTFSENITKHPYIRVTDFNAIGVSLEGLKYIDEDVYEKISRYTISSDDIYVSIAGSIGKVGIIPSCIDGANLTENAAKITNIKGINQKYLCLFLKSEFAQYQMQSATIATTQAKLALFRIESLTFPLPPLSEQQRIVERIEELFAKLDEAKERLQEVADSFAVRKAAILHKAFTGELIGKQVTELVPLENLVDLIKIGPFGSSLHESDYIENGIPLVNPKHIVQQRIVPQSKISISDEKAEELSSYKLKENDIVLGRRGEMGRCAPISNREENWICGTGSMIIRLKKEYDAKLYSLILGSQATVTYLENSAVGSTLKNLNEKIVRKIPVPQFSNEEQHEIVRLIDDLLARERKAQQATEQALASIDLMKKSILARAFRGELGTNKASEASALELLKQVLAEN